MKKVRISPPHEINNCTITLPASKSIANRLLIINSISNPNFKLDQLSVSGDTETLVNILNNLEKDIYAGDAGRVYRFLTALLSAKAGTWNLSGSERMHKRPIGPLVDALINAGADIVYKGEKGFPPLQITGKNISGGTVEIDPSLSSQFVSALLMIAPAFTDGLTLRLTKEPASVPYIQMTIDLMRSNGVEVNWQDDTIQVFPGKYLIGKSSVELDWSSAAFWYELCALGRNISIDLPGLFNKSIQGDAYISILMNQFFARTEFSEDGVCIKKIMGAPLNKLFRLDCNDIPDLVPVLACTCAGLGLEAQFSNVRTLKIKESNRIIALQTELGKLGIRCGYDHDDDILYIEKGLVKNYSGILNTHNDHRLAMALAPLAVICGPIILDDASVVSKSYPDFWAHMHLLGFKLEYL